MLSGASGDTVRSILRLRRQRHHNVCCATHLNLAAAATCHCAIGRCTFARPFGGQNAGHDDDLCMGRRKRLFLFQDVSNCVVMTETDRRPSENTTSSPVGGSRSNEISATSVSEK